MSPRSKREMSADQFVNEQANTCPHESAVNEHQQQSVSPWPYAVIAIAAGNPDLCWD